MSRRTAARGPAIAVASFIAALTGVPFLEFSRCGRFPTAEPLAQIAAVVAQSPTFCSPSEVSPAATTRIDIAAAGILDSAWDCLP